MEGLELISFNIIAYSGDAKSYYVEAIECAKEKDFEAAEQKIKAGQESQLEAHRAHMRLLTDSASGKATNVDILLLHAEDQLMSCEVIKLMANEVIGIYKIILNL